MDNTLYTRAKYFYEMGLYEYEAHSHQVKKDLNLRLIIGYTIGQAMELTLKQLLDDLEGEHPETHKPAVLCHSLEKLLSGKVPTKLPLVAGARLKTIISEIMENAKVYGDLAYGARYVADIKLAPNQLDNLIKTTEKLLLFYGSLDW